LANRITQSGIGDLRRKMIGWVGQAKTDDVIGVALKAGAEAFGDEIERTYRTYRRTSKERKKKRSNFVRIQEAVKKGAKGRMTKNGAVYFSAVDRKKGPGAPQASWLHRGRKVQPAKPEVFNGAISRARTTARNITQAKLWKAVSEMFNRI
jgi:hypothetical protein